VLYTGAMLYCGLLRKSYFQELNPGVGHVTTWCLIPLVTINLPTVTGIACLWYYRGSVVNFNVLVTGFRMWRLVDRRSVEI